MKQFLKYVLATVTGIVLLLVIVGILGAISLVGLAAKSAGSMQVEENSVYTMNLSGILNERTASNPLAELTGQISDNLGLDEMLAAIRKAKENEDIKGIYIEAGAFNSDTPASAHAIREALLDFKKSGKWIVAYGDSYTQTTYYICSVADKLFLNPQGMVDWHGLGGEKYFIKDLLVFNALKQRVDRLQRSFQAVVIIARVYPRLFHKAKTPRAFLHDAHEDPLRARRQIFDHIGHVEERDPAVPGRVGRLKVAYGAPSRADIGAFSDHSEQQGALLSLFRRGHRAQTHIFLVSIGVVADQVTGCVQPFSGQELCRLGTDPLEFSDFCLKIHLHLPKETGCLRSIRSVNCLDQYTVICPWLIQQTKYRSK